MWNPFKKAAPEILEGYEDPNNRYLGMFRSWKRDDSIWSKSTFLEHYRICTGSRARLSDDAHISYSQARESTKILTHLSESELDLVWKAVEEQRAYDKDVEVSMAEYDLERLLIKTKNSKSSNTDLQELK